jgi:hypothetical protein
MRTGNLSGHLTLFTDRGAVDVAEASSGQVLIAAVSPVVFFSGAIEAAGISAGLCFSARQSLCPVALGVRTMGLIGAATSELVAAELARLGRPYRTCSIRWIWIPPYGYHRGTLTFRPGSPR